MNICSPHRSLSLPPFLSASLYLRPSVFLISPMQTFAPPPASALLSDSAVDKPSAHLDVIVGCRSGEHLKRPDISFGLNKYAVNCPKQTSKPPERKKKGKSVLPLQILKEGRFFFEPLFHCICVTFSKVLSHISLLHTLLSVFSHVFMLLYLSKYCPGTPHVFVPMMFNNESTITEIFPYGSLGFYLIKWGFCLVLVGGYFPSTGSS